MRNTLSGAIRRLRRAAGLLRVVALAAVLLLAVGQRAIAGSSCISPWQARTGTAIDDELHAAVRDPAGNVYVAGFENGVLGVANDWPVGEVRGIVEKRGANGALAWRRVFAIPGSITLVEALAFDDARNRLAIVGRTSGAFPGAVNRGQFDLFVALLDGDTGEVVALGQFGDQYPQHPMSVAVVSSGELVVAGLDDAFIEGNAVLGQPTQFVARFAQRANDPASFELQWWRQPNEPAPLSIRSAAFGVTRVGKLGDDVAVVTRVSAAPARGGGVHLVRLDARGNVAWNQLISPTALDVGFTVAAARSGRLYLAGITVLALAGQPLGGSDGFVMERDVDTGALAWGRQFGSVDADWVATLAIDEQGDLFIAGNTNDVVVAGSTRAPNSAYALVFSADGDELAGWQSPMPSSSFLDSLSIVPSCDGTALIAGNAKGAFAGLDSLGGNDAVILPIRTVDPADAILASGFE